MIHIFRKEMKKWHTVLWVVVAAFALSSLSMLFFRSPNVGNIKIATVNGYPIKLDKFRKNLADLQTRMTMLRQYAKMFGITEKALLLEYFGKESIPEIALDTCIREALVDNVKAPFNIEIANDFFQEELVKTMPQGIVDAHGKLNMESYRGYLTRLNLTPSEFEALKEEEFKRNLINRFVTNSFYFPEYQAQDSITQSNSSKSFEIAKFEYDKFLADAKKNAVSEKVLKQAYDKMKNRYRVPEKRNALYWQISPKDYAKKITISDSVVRSFYERNKTAKFRIAPKVSVRHIFLKDGEKVLDEAKKLHEILKADPGKFAELARKHSQDAKTAQNGGLVAMFGRGTYDKDFETAAFRLKEKGELSGIVKTNDGYEIIQLHDRLKATYKPLDSVREEIITTLKAKKSLANLKADLERLSHKMRSDVKALDTFVKANGLEQKESSWVTKKEQKDEFDRLLAKRLFSSYPGQRKHGYFVHNGVYTVYKFKDEQKSYIKKFEEVKSDVEKRHYNRKAKEALRDAVKDSRRLLFAGKASFEDIVKKYGISSFSINDKKRTDDIDSVKDTGALKNKIFGLTDAGHVLQYAHDNDYYLVKLKNSKLDKIENIAKEKQKVAEREQLVGNRAQMGMFIEFLRKNAKINVDKNIMSMFRG